VIFFGFVKSNHVFVKCTFSICFLFFFFYKCGWIIMLICNHVLPTYMFTKFIITFRIVSSILWLSNGAFDARAPNANILTLDLDEAIKDVLNLFDYLIFPCICEPLRLPCKELAPSETSTIARFSWQGWGKFAIMW
jgi:hypothetical protein